MKKQTFDKNYCSFFLGCEGEKIQEIVIIAPCWRPETVGIEQYELIANNDCLIWDCKLNDTPFTYIVTGVGACKCLDVITSLKYTKCKKLLFLGSAGAITKKYKIGDIVFPKAVICAEGASRFLEEEMCSDTYGKLFKVSPTLWENLTRQAPLDKRIHIYSDTIGISVESIASQFKHIDEFLDLGAECIDMEASAFLASSQYINCECAICFCISDNSSNNEPLMELSEEQTIFRKQIRKDIVPKILELFIN